MRTVIRAASPEDSERWIRLRFELWPDCSPQRHRLEVTQILTRPGIVALAFVDEELGGFAEVSVRTDHVDGTSAAPVPYLEGWYVRSVYRGRGVGRALLSFVEQWAISQGFSELASDAELQNSHSIGLHAALGFREVGRNVHFVKVLKPESAAPDAAPDACSDAAPPGSMG